ncbi:hypothetical protein [Marinifilum caeruleilacunae]|uniref:Uncharacterized protein n=1 Tax=Marinifilum caeruleilacunae TaxID=2499076 RepID=A0ABX1X1L4_9BACT|nr:hypothetical protein [Marinifilum caeruleilacunae]NOU62310.1 hypothetical protein [Marinifilum caeruleilacunae]
MEDEILIKHLLLDKIAELKNTNAVKLSSLLNLDIDVCYSYCEEINYDGYIDFIDACSMDGKDALVTINGKGLIFFKNGGYEMELSITKKEFTSESRRSFLKTTSTIVGILTGISTLILGPLAFIQNREINELKGQINVVPTLKNELIGKWVNHSNISNSYYIFSNENTWEYITYGSGEKIVYKGEYQLGRDNGVFLRSFGSHHWGHDSTYIDIKSSIGSSYMFIKNDELINNQEDYEIKYRKVK